MAKKRHQNFSRNSFGVTIEMFSNGFKISKSGSLVIIRSAWPESASSRNILSLWSRQMETVWLTLISLLCKRYRWIKRSFSYSLLKYFSNFFFFKVTSNSVVTGKDRMILWSVNALRIARSVIDPFKIAALIRALVSRTSFIYDSSFIKSFNASSVMPCFRAYSLMSSITCGSVRLSSSNRKSVSRVNDFFSSESCDNLLANSSLTSSVIVFIVQR